MRRLSCVVFCGLAVGMGLLPRVALAETIRVPLDQPTIQAGIDAAGTGDLVLVAPGTYTGPGNHDLDFGGRDITLRSEAGAASTMIDCQDQGRGFFLHGGETSAAVIEGFTITGGSADFGAGMLVTGATTAPTILSCHFATNITFDLGGGALYLEGSTPTFTDCTFTANEGNHGSGGVAFLDGASAVFTGCRMSGNSATFYGGGIYALNSTLTLTSCILDGNSTIAYGGAIASDASTLELTGCTLSDNAAVFGGGGGGLRLDGGTTATATNTIIAFSSDGEAVSCTGGSSASLSCCDVFGNADGDWTGCIAGQQGQDGNFGADPLFCDRPGGDFALNAASPCQPANSPGACGLVGALGVGCGTVAIPDPAQSPLTETTWGAIKATHRR